MTEMHAGEEDVIPDHEILESEITPTELHSDRLAHLLLTAWTIVLEAERDSE